MRRLRSNTREARDEALDRLRGTRGIGVRQYEDGSATVSRSGKARMVAGADDDFTAKRKQRAQRRQRSARRRFV